MGILGDTHVLGLIVAIQAQVGGPHELIKIILYLFHLNMKHLLMHFSN